MRNKKIFPYSKTSLSHKVLLVLFGALAAVFVLEAGLRTAGFILRTAQEYRNLVFVRKHGEYRIMCIGESTTSGQYPRFLEEALARRDLGIKATVIDKGLVAANTSFILSRLEENIKKYHPDLVIAMIGVNDGGAHMPSGSASDSKNFFNSMKTYKLAKLLILHIENKIVATRALKERNKAPVLSLKREEPDKGRVLYEQGIPKKLALGEVEKREVKDDDFFYNQGARLFEEGDLVSGRKAFRRAIFLNPYFVAAYLRLASSYDENAGIALEKEILGKYKILLKAGVLNKDNFDEKQIKDVFELCRILIRKGIYQDVEEFCGEMLANNFSRGYAYFLLAETYFQQKKYTAAEGLFMEAVRLNITDSRVFDHLAVIYHERGQYDLSEEYLRRAEELRPDYPLQVTINNYREIKNILDRENIKLVCMQYPMRSIEPWKKIFGGERNIIFVDNERVFKDAMKDMSYGDLFKDMFAGDFGHCTDKGNRLLAENAADVITKEAFHK